jgi:hypothetical protein
MDFVTYQLRVKESLDRQRTHADIRNLQGSPHPLQELLGAVPCRNWEAPDPYEEIPVSPIRSK